ncbi:MAG: hypothetical protein AAFN79_12315 [Pseudomonadota bacterium]
MRPAFRMSFGGAWENRRVESEAEAKARAALRLCLDEIAAEEDGEIAAAAAVYRMAAYRLPTERLGEIVAALQRGDRP